jgi:hypothetical protein
VALAGKAHLVGNGSDGQLGGPKQVLGLDDPVCNYILMRRLPGGLLEEAGKVIRAYPGGVRYGGEGQIRIEMGVDKLQDAAQGRP